MMCGCCTPRRMDSSGVAGNLLTKPGGARRRFTTLMATVPLYFLDVATLPWSNCLSYRAAQLIAGNCSEVIARHGGAGARGEQEAAAVGGRPDSGDLGPNPWRLAPAHPHPHVPTPAPASAGAFYCPGNNFCLVK